jgi:hypothetical protein
MLLSAVSVLVIVLQSSEIPEELMNNPVLFLHVTLKPHMPIMNNNHQPIVHTLSLYYVLCNNQ